MQKKSLSIKHSSITFFVSFILCQLGVIAMFCLASIFFALFKVNLSHLEPFFKTCTGYLLTTIAMDLVMITIFVFTYLKYDNKIFKKVKFYKVILYIIVAIASFFMLYPIVSCVDKLLIHLGYTPSTIPYELTFRTYLTSIISIAILPAVCEDLIFRGIIFKGLKAKGKYFSTILVSVMFAIFHMSVFQTVYPLIFGLLLAIIMYKEDNIFYCIIAHATNNFLALTLQYLNISLVINHWAYILIACILLVVYLTSIMIALAKTKTTSKEKLTQDDKLYITISMAVMILIWVFLALG